MKPGPVVATPICPHCKADLLPDQRVCWLCRQPVRGGEEIVMAQLAPTPHKSPLSNSYFIAITILCLVAAALIGLGLLQEDTGLLIPYAIVLIPALIATGGRWLAARSRGEKMSGGSMVLTFFSSLAVTISVIVVLVAAAIIALFAICIFTLSQIGGGNGS